MANTTERFGIHDLPVGVGILAIAPCAGRAGAYDADLGVILAWHPQLVISMTSFAELAGCGAAGMPDDLRGAGVTWAHVPVADYGVPDDDVAWHVAAQNALAVLAVGGRVLVHCMGGCGRSGMAVLRLMIAAGEDAQAALVRLRAVRPCAVETDAQMRWAMA